MLGEVPAVRRGVVVARHEVVGHRHLVDQGADAVLAGQTEAGEVAGVDDGLHLEALGQAPGQLQPERVEVHVADVQDARVAVEGGSQGIGCGAEELVELPGQVRQPVADAGQRPDLALHGLEDRRGPLQRAFEAGCLEGIGVEALPGGGLQPADGDQAGRGAEGHVAPAPAREQRAGHRAGEHRHDEGTHDEVPHERGDVDAGLGLEAAERVVVAGQVTGPLDVELGDTGLDLQRGVVGVDDHPTERGQLEDGVAAPAPPHRDAHVARADAALGRHERQRRDRGERAAHDRGVGKCPSEPAAVAGALG